MTFMLVGILLFSLMDVLVKLAAARYPIGQIVFCRNFFAFVPLAFFIGRAGGVGVLRTAHIAQHLVRAATGVGAMFLFFWAFALLPLADAVALGQAAPIFLCALSVPLLGERVGVRRWSAVAVGFIGVLAMTRPGAGIFEPAALAPIAGAALYALAMITIRRLGRAEPAATIVFYFTLFATLAGAATLPFGWRLPDAWGLAALIAIGLVGGCAQMALTQAFRLAPVSAVAPFEYGGLVFAVAFGYLIWGDFPDAFIWTGAATVVASGLYILHREAILARSRRPERSSE